MPLLAAAPLLALLAAALPAGAPEFAGAPFLRYSPETAWGYGACGAAWFAADDVARAAGRSSWVGLGLQHTTRRQSAGVVQWDAYLDETRWRTDGALLAERWPHDFWGIGRRATGRSEPFTSSTLRLEAALSRLVHPSGGAGQGLWLGLRGGARREDLDELAPGGLVDTCAVSGCRGGRWGTLLATAAWDTRDHVFSAWDGLWLSARAGLSKPFAGGQGWRELDLDLRGYHAAAPLPGQLSAQLRLWATDGDVPFFALPAFGGDRLLRGVLEGRFRDGTSAVAQAEWTVPVAGRLGAAIFGGAAAVAPRPGDLTLRRVVGAGGGGLRWTIDRAARVTVRADYGASSSGARWYLAIGQAM